LPGDYTAVVEVTLVKMVFSSNRPKASYERFGDFDENIAAGVQGAVPARCSCTVGTYLCVRALVTVAERVKAVQM